MIASRYATQLFSCYRLSEASDPELYVANVAATLCEYPESVVSKVCHRTGLPKQSKWLPSIFELVEALEKANGTWRPPDGTLSPQGYVYDSTKIGGINFLAEPRNRRFYYDD
jgi:hypothetical protein